MASVLDVAAYIVAQQGTMTAMKLQKLVYYSQAWSLVWDEKPLFQDDIEAWKNGPVVPRLYDAHRGQFNVEGVPGGNPDALDQQERETVDAVLGYYAGHSAQWLSDLTHAEDPWKYARGDAEAHDRSNAVITHAAMVEYYSSLSPDEQAQA